MFYYSVPGWKPGCRAWRRRLVLGMFELELAWEAQADFGNSLEGKPVVP